MPTPTMEPRINKSASNKDWTEIVKIASDLKSPFLREFVLGFLDTEVPDYFAEVPASSSGKYHPAESLGYGGLCRHTIAVAKVVMELGRVSFFKFTAFDKELLIAAALLHDSFKQGSPCEGHTIKQHPRVAVDHLLAYGKKISDEQTDPHKKESAIRISRQIASLVLTHMGEWGNNGINNNAQLVLHLADLVASRKNIKVE